ncbi:MAG: hypothetical protein JWR38_1958 [Mucilaginibacter sp.]|nr:hypothetical protein [Mucilaginibacter sp.]
MKKIKISSGQYLSDIMPEIPTNAIIYKTLTGIGATTLEINTPRNSIIMEPNVPVIKGKKQKGMLSIYEGVAIDEVIDYLSGETKHKKLMVTPESFFKIKEAAELLSIDLYKDYMFLFDESDRIIQDAGFRKKITFPMDDFFKFKSKAFISATALAPSDPRFSENGFATLVIEPDFDYSKPIDLITTNNVYLTLKSLLDNAISENYCIFFNSTNMIGAYIKKMEIQNESQVYCSRESTYQLRISEIPHVADHLKKFRKYNFFTSRFNSAVDIFMDSKPVVIIVTDLNSAMHSMVHPKTESVQIVGRFRNGVDKIVHITNLNPELKPKSEEEVKGWLSGCEQTYNDLSALHKATTNQGSKDTLAECLTLVTYANFINADGSKNYFMEDNMFLEEEIKRAYVEETSFQQAYKLPHFKSTHISELYPLSDQKSDKLTSGISMLKVVEAVIESLNAINDSSLPYTIDNRQTVMNDLEKSFPEILEAYRLLGPAELRKNGYSKKQIKKAVKLKKEKDQKSSYGFLKSLQSSFEDGVDYPTSELKKLTQSAISIHGLDLHAHIKLLKEYFELGPRKTLGFDSNKNEIKGYKVVRCKFNRIE